MSYTEHSISCVLICMLTYTKAIHVFEILLNLHTLVKSESLCVKHVGKFC